MNITRKLALSLVAGALSIGVIGVSAPAAQARDSSWGCGGFCATTNS